MRIQTSVAPEIQHKSQRKVSSCLRGLEPMTQCIPQRRVLHQQSYNMYRLRQLSWLSSHGSDMQSISTL